MAGTAFLEGLVGTDPVTKIMNMVGRGFQLVLKCVDQPSSSK